MGDQSAWQPAGKWLLARLDVQLDPDTGWTAWEDLRFAADGSACVYERPFDKGKLVVALAIVAPALFHFPENTSATDYLIHRLANSLEAPISAIPGQRGTIVLPIETDNGSLACAIAPNRMQRYGRKLFLKAPKGQKFEELWSNQTVSANESGEIELFTEDGIALLWNSQ